MLAPMKLALQNFTIVGAGTIGLSFSALHLARSKTTNVTICDPRPDLADHISNILPTYLPPSFPTVQELLASGRLRTTADLKEACKDADVVQEQGPEQTKWKQEIWAKIEPLVSDKCHLWSSTSGIRSSIQNQLMSQEGRKRHVVVHPFNPPHIMPLIEIVGSPETPEHLLQVPEEYFDRIGHRPVIIKKECTGFVGNRLAFVLFREACKLVADGVCSAKDVDAVIEASVGIRWGIKGPFASYNDGGGAGGLKAFMGNVGLSAKDVWTESWEKKDGGLEGKWEEMIVEQAREAYGTPTKESLVDRNRITMKVIETIREERRAIAEEKLAAAKK
ncbi:3-hydroxyacyl-CoA dehydrogenase [Pyronema domesticum]|uniref:Similar to Lambda-crystallin homolog acc. no. Q8SPX7 n=1 Tax=Pyronema omphalodes (strain CBS 100304) TaxID=1076935 RepID=U4LR09_PYROM|nr:3-hydroxyacyl-CoA dehydrogenase [Pyronema domesticum]CCX34004.1 Similar to Lambda-crystallin homolog; acc. no. Q8SPX7 [Pyronema omphalodes CBS 100304]